MSASEIVNKVWNYAHVLRDDGVGYGDYVEQITYLIFLKMADERQKAGQETKVPKKYTWAKLVKLDGDDLDLALSCGCRGHAVCLSGVRLWRLVSLIFL